MPGGVGLARFAARDAAMEMCRGICPGWWCRGGVVWRRPEICSSRIGWLMVTVRWSCRSRRIFAELAACGRPATTQRSYGMDLLRWFRFLWAIGVAWDQATRVEARDFCRWLQIADKPIRPHWRRPDGDLARSGRSRTGAGRERGDRQGGVAVSLRGGDGGALRDRAAWVLRLSSGGGHRADGQPVPAVSASQRRARACPPQPDGARSPGNAVADIGRSW